MMHDRKFQILGSLTLQLVNKHEDKEQENKHKRTSNKFRVWSKTYNIMRSGFQGMKEEEVA